MQAVALRVPPLLELVPDHAYSDLEEALAVARMLGIELDDWQVYSLAVALARTEDERWAAPTVGLIVPRQNGKGVVLEVRAITGALRLDEELVMWSAHEYKTARESFLRVEEHVSRPEFYEEHVKKIRTANGEESIEFRNGARLRFLARTAGSGRGFTGYCTILDEGFAVTDSHVAAMRPALAAVPDPQVLYASMAGTPDASVLRRRRDSAVAGAERLAWLEWGAEDGADFDDPETWQRANPAMPHRVRVQAVADERAEMSDEDFARERLCMWGTNLRQPVVDPDVWAALADPHSKPTGQVAFAVSVPPEGRRAALARAGRRADGRIHVEVDVRPGTQWAVTRLAELAKRRKAPVTLNPAGRSNTLIADLALERVKPDLVSLRDRAAACGAFVDLVEVDGLRHMGQVELNVALDGATKRTAGESWVFQRLDDSVDISPLEAAVLAVHGLRSKPPKRQTGKAMFV